MRRMLLAAALAALALPAAGAQARPAADVTVGPAGVSPTGKVYVRFLAPATEGNGWYYRVRMATPRRGRRVCDARENVVARLKTIRRGQRIVVVLRPDRPARRWCRGLWTGAVWRHRPADDDDYYDDCAADEICRFAAAAASTSARRRPAPLPKVIGRFRIWIG